jgi:hypothetical protein
MELDHFCGVYIARNRRLIGKFTIAWNVLLRCRVKNGANTHTEVVRLGQKYQCVVIDATNFFATNA